MSTLRDNICTYMIIPCWILLRMRHILDNIFREIQNLYFMFSNLPPLPPNRAVYEIMWKNMIKPDRSQMEVWCGAEKMRLACWVLRKEYRHSLTICNTHCFSTATLVTGTLLSVTYIACLVFLTYEQKCVSFHIDRAESARKQRGWVHATLKAPRIWNLLLVS
jgi:hypothetical protein